MGIIRRPEDPTDWVNGRVVMEKPNRNVRLCLDPKDLDAHIKRENYHLPHKSVR